jgi:hypothetical protein
MAKFKKGSAAAKAYMAKLRAAKGKTKVNKTKSKKVGATEFSWKRIDNDVNGNPRYVTSFSNLLSNKEKYESGLSVLDQYDLAVRKAKKLGGKKFSNKQYGGGIVFQSYNIEDTEKRIKSLLNDNVSGTKKPSSMHKDTKSHNVNIRVMSGTKKTKKYSIGNVNYSKLLTDIAKEDKLKAAVVRSVKSHAKDYGSGSDAIKEYIKDVLRAGGQSGIISELIYYSDTTAWFKKYNSEISKLLRYSMEEFGYDNPSDLFGSNWDKYDPFANDTQNQNLLAWFSYEETCREIGNRLGFDI